MEEKVRQVWINIEEEPAKSLILCTSFLVFDAGRSVMMFLSCLLAPLDTIEEEPAKSQIQLHFWSLMLEEVS